MNKESFEAAIQQDRYDLATRLAFSDWLSENGFDTEAEWQRTWTKERQESEDFLCMLAQQFGKTCTNWGEQWDSDSFEPTGIEEIWRDITLEDVVQAGHDYIDKHDWFVQMGNDTARDMMHGELLDQYWFHWSVYTGRDPAQPDQWGSRSPFSCSC